MAELQLEEVQHEFSRDQCAASVRKVIMPPYWMQLHHPSVCGSVVVSYSFTGLYPDFVFLSVCSNQGWVPSGRRLVLQCGFPGGGTIRGTWAGRMMHNQMSECWDKSRVWTACFCLRDMIRELQNWITELYRHCILSIDVWYFKYFTKHSLSE